MKKPVVMALQQEEKHGGPTIMPIYSHRHPPPGGEGADLPPSYTQSEAMELQRPAAETDDGNASRFVRRA